MTVDNENNSNSYTGDNSTTVFAYTFRILDDDDITVTVNGTVQTKTTHYTVSGVDDSGGGNITFVTAPATSAAIVFKRGASLTQSVDLVENDAFPSDTVEDALDRLTMMIQQLQYQLDDHESRIDTLES